MTRHQDIVARASFDDELRLIGRRARFISGLVVHCVLQLSTIGCDLKQEEVALCKDFFSNSSFNGSILQNPP